MFRKLKEQLAPTTPGFRTLCPTCWTVRAASLQSVADNWTVLQELWEECLATKLKPDIKGRVPRMQHQMTTFDCFFGVNLAILLLKHSDNLSRTLQNPNMLVVECQSVTNLTTSTLAKVRSDQRFALFWEKVKRAADSMGISAPVLPQKRQRPARCFVGDAPAEFSESAEEHYRRIYFEAIDTVVKCIESRFNQ